MIHFMVSMAAGAFVILEGYWVLWMTVREAAKILGKA